MFEAEKTYHIYNRANGIENLFIEEKNYDFFLDKYFKHIALIAETFVFCLMPNHFHIMIKIKSEDQVIDCLGIKTFQKFETFGKLISKQFANLFSSYTQSLNKEYSRTGILFQPNMKKKEVVSDAYFTQLILYIHNNPVKHGFVKSIYDWKYSSIHQLADGTFSRLNKIDVIDWFGGIDYFKRAHEDIAKIQSIFD